MSTIPERYEPERVNPDDMGSWLRWSLGFFTEPVLQDPHLDVTVQQDVTAAYADYLSGKAQTNGQGTFFAYLVWHLAQTLASHPSLNLRWLDGAWYVLRNPPIYIPVAVGGEARFREIVLEDVYQQSYPDFLENYLRRLQEARQTDFKPANTSDVFRYAHFMGNLPYLRFTGLTLHWRSDQMVGQSFFYFGQRYSEGARLMVPLAVKLHHSCSDPLLLNALLDDFAGRFAEPAGGKGR